MRDAPVCPRVLRHVSLCGDVTRLVPGDRRGARDHIYCST